MESLASVVAENLPKLPVAAEAGGLDVAGEAFNGGSFEVEKNGEVEGPNVYIYIYTREVI